MVHLGITYAAENVLTDSVEDVSGAAMELPNSVAPYWSLEGVDGQEAWSPCTPSSCVCGESLMGLCTWAECKWDTPPIDCLNDAPEGVQWKWNEAGFYQAMRQSTDLGCRARLEYVVVRNGKGENSDR